MRELTIAESELVAGAVDPTLLGSVQVHFTRSTSGQSFGFAMDLMLDSMSASPGEDEHDHDDPIGPDDPPGGLDLEYMAAVATLQANTTFQALPALVQNLIFASPTLTNALAVATIAVPFQIGNTGDANGQYWPYGDTPFLRINAEKVAQAHLDETMALTVVGIIAHEVGHHLTFTTVTEGQSRESYIDAGITREALAVVFSLLVWHELGNQGSEIAVTGGQHNHAYEDMYVNYLNGGSLDGLVNGIKTYMYHNTPYPARIGEAYDQQDPWVD